MKIRCGAFIMFWVFVYAATVVEKNIPYVCQEGTVTLEGQLGAVDPLCDQSWIIGKKPIAYYENERGQCISPCKGVFSGKLYLGECANVTFTYGCTNNGLHTETRLHFLAMNRSAAKSKSKQIAFSLHGHLAFLAILNALCVI